MLNAHRQEELDTKMTFSRTRKTELTKTDKAREDDSMEKVISLDNYKEKTAILIFSDLRGFTPWSQRHQNEVKKLTRMFYSLAIQVFGERKSTTLIRRVVKFLGDGFFAVNEYDDEENESFYKSLAVSLKNIIEFVPAFYTGISQSNLHDRGEIKAGFGVSYGTSFRFNMPGRPLDYVGSKINLAARLCGIAQSSEIVIEYDLKDHICATEIGRKPNIEYRDDRVDLRGIGDTVICRITDRNSFVYEYRDLRHLSALIDLIKQASK
jgi:class 3 adenylate cyclase